MAFWETTDWYAYGRIVYAKSALVYEMLRHQLGDETFYQAWQNIYEQALHRNIRARALQEYFEAAANESLDWFFNQWVYGSGVITLSLGAISVQQDFAGWTITFELLQEQSVPIRLRVPVGITFSTRAELFWVWMEADSTSTHVITVSEFPLMITLDPQQYLLCQYGISSVNLTIAPGSPVALVITGVAIGGIIVGVVILLWRRRQSMGGSSQKMRTHVIMWF